MFADKNTLIRVSCHREVCSTAYFGTSINNLMYWLLWRWNSLFPAANVNNNKVPKQNFPVFAKNIRSRNFR